ncbi:GNAT family N-acetyltransferase [Inquilinus limosus]|uniref:GNAT family N-acetyltransferase n=1 Tax=Inquilinus limosus TaxID=171674 RepID=UPI00040323F0|nr:GNAT family N-acetyltransferase [Inquilinus limosus]
MTTHALRIVDADGGTADLAVDLLARFLHEEGFATPAAMIARSVREMIADPHHWVGLAWLDGSAVGVATVTTMIYVEGGRLGEIGDLYVLPAARRRGVAAALIAAATARCAAMGCSEMFVVVTPEGEARHGLEGFYSRFGFAWDGRRLLTRRLG